MNRSIAARCIALMRGAGAGILFGAADRDATSTLRTGNAGAEVTIDTAPAAVHRSGRAQGAVSSLEVEVRVAGNPAPGVVVEVLRFERVDGAPEGQWVAASRAMTDAQGVASFRVPAARHVVIALLERQRLSRAPR